MRTNGDTPVVAFTAVRYAKRPRVGSVPTHPVSQRTIEVAEGGIDSYALPCHHPVDDMLSCGTC